MNISVPKFTEIFLSPGAEIFTLSPIYVYDVLVLCLAAGQMCSTNIISTPSTPSSSSQPPDDILKFYRDQGFDKIAKEVGTCFSI